jgi:hypothetical protein
MEKVGCASQTSAVSGQQQAPVPGQYIITEDELRNNADGICLDDIMKIRSRPVQQPAPEDVLKKYMDWLQEMADIANNDANRQENFVRKVDYAGKCSGFLQAKERLEQLVHQHKQGGKRE